MLFNRLGNRTENNACFFQLFLERRANGYGIEHRVHGNLAALDWHIFCALDTGQDRLFFERDTQLFVCLQQLGIDLVQ